MMENLYGFLQSGISPVLGVFEKIASKTDQKEYEYDNTDNYYFICIIKGKCKILFNNTVYEMENKKAYLFNSNQTGILRFVNPTPDLELYLLEFKDAFFLSQHCRNEHKELMDVEVLDHDLCLIHSTLCNLILMNDASAQNDDLIMRQLLILLVLSIIKSFQSEEKNQGKKDDLAEKIKQYIDENYKENISLHSISKKFFITPDYVSHIFKEEFGISPIKYLINKRINVSKYLLMNTNNSVNIIALEVGYDNPAYFSSLFRKIEGISPANFRLSIKRNI